MLTGTRVEGRFKIEQTAGTGGMGVVYRARDELDGSPVAVKVLLRGEDELDVERFEREAAVLAELRHPGVVRHIAHGATPDGARYLVMEWLEGEDLERQFARKKLTLAGGLILARKAAAALAAAHDRGIVHRDIKPSNIFLVDGDVERLKLLDFGIAHALDETRRLTRSGVLMGTPGYMAPEQIQGGTAPDPRIDVFSLGCILFEALVGRPLFQGEHVMAILAKILIQEVPRLRALRPDAPAPLDHLLARMLAKNPAHRPRDAGELVAALDELGDVWSAWAAAAVPLPDEAGVRDSRLPTIALRDAITLHEQRLVSLVLAGPPPAGSAHDLSAPEIARHGGHLNVVAGGSLLVTLGGAGSAVDRAERAAVCALAMQRAFHGVPVCVVTGRGVVSAQLVEGEVIERGVRALSAAKADAVWLDSTTAAMLGSRFNVVADGDAFALRGERSLPDTAPLLLGKPTACLGRNRGISILEAVFSTAVEESRASAVVVTGSPGAGKSRLRRELVTRLGRREEPVEILCGWADSLGEGAPFGVIADALRRAAGIQGDEPLEARRVKLAARIGRHLEGEPRLHAVAFLGELTRTPFPDGESRALTAAREDARLMGDAMRAAWQTFLAAECAAHPVLLVLEDLHWGDAATVQLLDTTLRNLRDQPLMVLAMARPEVHAKFPALWVDRDVQAIKLGPLPRKVSDQLVRAALGERASDEIVARVVDRADGNPFFLEELIRTVDAGRTDDFPASILGIVEARLDAEGAEAKRILRAASIFGDHFSQQGVAVLLGGDASSREAGAWLEALASRELILPASRGGADPQYGFRHGLVREAAYAALTEADRALGHRLAGAWLEQGGHAEALALAEHFRRGEEPARAVRWYLRAAEEALDADDLAAVLERGERGVACGAAGEELGALRLALGEAHVWRSELALAQLDVTEAVELLPRGSGGWFHAVRNIVVAAGKLGDAEQVERWAERALVEPAHDASSARLRCLSECANYLVFGGRYAVADAVLAALVPGEHLDARARARIHEAHSIRASAAGDTAACVAGFEAALLASREAGDHRNACVTCSNLGFIYLELGDFERAEAALRTSLEAADRLGLQDLTAIARHNLGYALAYGGKLEEARRLEQLSVEAFFWQGDSRLEGLARTYLARIHLLAGDNDDAEEEALAAAELLIIAPPLRAGALATLARALLSSGRAASALPIAREAFAQLESLGSLEEGESLVRLVHAEALDASGDEEGFRRAIAAAHEQLLARAAKISDPTWRARFLSSVPDNARIIALATR